ncbi:hypothetical protein HAP94_05015 [Acidithiobacillus ferrivorans]|nr:hypothetical protein [Acidithiobacillus ferrivorans]
MSNIGEKEDEEGSEDVPSGEYVGKKEGLFGSAGIKLSSEEMSSSATVKFLRHINDNQESEISSLNAFMMQYYDKRQECEVLKKEKEAIENSLNLKKDLENVQKLMISIGSIVLGSLRFLKVNNYYFLGTLVLASIVLILAGLFPSLLIWKKK